MTLSLYRFDTVAEKPVLVATVTPDETDSPLFADFPPVWSEGEDPRPLHPADGEEYLKAVHEELKRGSMAWSILEF